jgi:hypothetical protein
MVYSPSKNNRKNRGIKQNIAKRTRADDATRKGDKSMRKPRGIHSIYDNPEYFNRYEIRLNDRTSLTVSRNASSPQGVSQWGWWDVEWDEVEAPGKEIKWADLPENVQEHVAARMKERA